MGIFNSNKSGSKTTQPPKSNSNKKETYNCAKFFSISRPWGYNPQEVDPAITKYNNLLAKQKGIIIKLKEENTSLKNEIQSLENELRDMQMQLSFATIPSVNSIQEEYILNEFDKAFQSEPRNNNNQQTTQNNQQIQTPVQTSPEYKEEESQVFDFDSLNYDENNVQTAQNAEDSSLLSDVVNGDYNCGEDSEDCVFDIPELSGNATQQNIESESSKSNENPDDFFKDFKF